jgi:hypothetical protein
MRKEWIRSEEEKHDKHLQLDTNRRRRRYHDFVHVGFNSHDFQHAYSEYAFRHRLYND